MLFVCSQHVLYSSEALCTPQKAGPSQEEEQGGAITEEHLASAASAAAAAALAAPTSTPVSSPEKPRAARTEEHSAAAAAAASTTTPGSSPARPGAAHDTPITKVSKLTPARVAAAGEDPFSLLDMGKPGSSVLALATSGTNFMTVSSMRRVNKAKLRGILQGYLHDLYDDDGPGRPGVVARVLADEAIRENGAAAAAHLSVVDKAHVSVPTRGPDVVSGGHLESGWKADDLPDSAVFSPEGKFFVIIDQRGHAKSMWTRDVTAADVLGKVHASQPVGKIGNADIHVLGSEVMRVVYAPNGKKANGKRKKAHSLSIKTVYPEVVLPFPESDGESVLLSVRKRRQPDGSWVSVEEHRMQSEDLKMMSFEASLNASENNIVCNDTVLAYDVSRFLKKELGPLHGKNSPMRYFLEVEAGVIFPQGGGAAGAASAHARKKNQKVKKSKR